MARCWFFAALLLASTNVLADESGWRTSWDGTLYGYAGSMSPRGDSILNPGNRIARLVQRSDNLEARFNFKAESETMRVTARPIVALRDERNAFGGQTRHEAYLSQYQMRVRAADGWNVAVGREVMNWGAAQFRSPSSPFYFDNGRSDPMRELAGMDALKLTWTPDMRGSFNVARIVRSGYGAAQPDMWRDSWLAKLDLRGDEFAYGAVAVKAPNLPAFYGAHGQMALNDAWLLYGEAGSSARPTALQSPADAAQPFAVQTLSPRRTTVLVGATYTAEDGKSLSAEYLHESHGYRMAEISAYFARATASTLLAAQALGLSPRLLGRDYLHLVWQSNMMESDGYWRVMYTRNATDGSNELGAYGETTLTPQLSAFAMGAWNSGNARQELSSLFTRSVTLGLKVALP